MTKVIEEDVKPKLLYLFFCTDETTGATDDYAKAIHGWKYPFTPELRGNSFIVDNSQIQPSFEEVWAGIVAKEGVIP